MSLWRCARRYGPALLVLALLVGAIATGAWRRLSLTELQAHHLALRALVHHRPALTLVAFFAVFTLVVVACIPGPGLMSVTAGYLFGWVMGGAVAVAACVTGSSLLFLACGAAFGDWAAARGGERLARLQAMLARDAFAYLLTLRLIPVMPFFAPTLAAALAQVPLRSLAAATTLGAAPVCFLLAGLGAGLGRMFDDGARLSPRLFERPAIILPLAALAILSAAPIAWRLARRRRAWR